MTTIDPRQFRNALGAFATGVTVVTTSDEFGNDVGLTANSFNSVSLEPPMVLWSLARNAGSLPAFMGNEHFAVHVLSNRQEAVSNRFAKRGVDKFTGLELTRGQGGVPLLSECAARFECRTAYRYEGGDHMIFVGEVLNFEHFDLPPLVYQSGGYALAVKKPAEYAAEDEAYLADSFGRNALTYLIGRVFHQLRFRLRPVLESKQLTDLEHQVIGVLGVQNDRSLDELDALLDLSNLRVSQPLLAGLVDRQLIVLSEAEQGVRARLTDAGRRLNIELLAATKAIEDEVTEGFDHGEMQVITHLMRRMARDSNVDVPPLWKKPV